MVDDNTKDAQKPNDSNEIEPLADESLEDVAGGTWCSIIGCSGQTPAPTKPAGT